LQAEVSLVVTQEQMDAINILDMKIHQVLIVSKVNLSVGKAMDITISLADGVTCDRCWNVVDHVHENGLCKRCNTIVGGL
jgi:isoleucyl-tRNA synthetase